MNRLLTVAEASSMMSEDVKRIAKEQSEANGTRYEDELRYGVAVLGAMFFEGPGEMPDAPRPVKAPT